VTQGTPVRDPCHIDRKEKERIQKLEAEHEAANDLKRSLIHREESRTYSVPFEPERYVGFQIDVYPASRIAGDGIVAPEQARSLVEAQMFHADHQVDPRFVSAAVPIGQSGAYSYKKRLGAEIWRRRGLSCIPQETDSHLSFHAKPSAEVSGQAKIYAVGVEWAAEQIVAVVLVADSELPWVILVLSRGTVPGPRWSALTNARWPLGPCRGRKDKGYPQ
jgi:hypothetical protein